MSLTYLPLVNLIAHSIYAVQGLRANLQSVPVSTTNVHTIHWFHSLVLASLCTSGSGSVNSLLFHSPAPFFTNPAVIPVATIVWYLIFQRPLGDAFYKIISNPIPQILIFFFEALNLTFSVSATIDKAAKTFPGVPLSWLIVGTIGACGGSIIQLLDAYIRRTNVNMSIDGGLRTGFILSVIYVTLTYPSRFFMIPLPSCPPEITLVILFAVIFQNILLKYLYQIVYFDNVISPFVKLTKIENIDFTKTYEKKVEEEPVVKTEKKAEEAVVEAGKGEGDKAQKLPSEPVQDSDKDDDDKKND
eukprot:TRINITY_DN12581_c0_g1_i1.p1 TRINITY_DN12581_c0_g1~~TRINITY_DN12581_c0_g1_i1.p1  ORF type:complete len:302 (+),score=114.90 TRINITY_DN12581_c0_g1_i1:1-906(+)